MAIRLARPLQQLSSVRCGGGRSRGGGCSPVIGNQVAQGRVRFMADSCHYRNAAERYGPDNGLEIEGPKIFERTAAPREHYQIRPRPAEVVGPLPEPLKGANDFRGRIRALYRNRQERAFEQGLAKSHGACDIPQRRA